MKPRDEYRPDLAGDGYNPEPLLNAEQLARKLNMPVKSVYELPIPRIVLGPRRIRWRPADVQEFINSRLTRG